jgi:hypothetical protein
MGDLGAYGGGASIGSELPEFVTPNIVAPEK